MVSAVLGASGAGVSPAFVHLFHSLGTSFSLLRGEVLGLTFSQPSEFLRVDVGHSPVLIKCSIRAAATLARFSDVLASL